MILTILGIITGVVATVTGIIGAFSRTDRLLTEIRDVLIQIRDKDVS